MVEKKAPEVIHDPLELQRRMAELKREGKNGSAPFRPFESRSGFKGRE